jgi:hypothetical protein
VVRWQSSSASSSCPSFMLVSNYSRRYSIAHRREWKANEGRVASGRTPAKQRWFRRALRKRGLSESVSVSPGRNRLGPPKRCNWVGPFLRNKGISTLEKDLKSSEIIAQIVSCRACRRRRRRPSADERMQKSMDCFRITSSAAPPT